MLTAIPVVPVAHKPDNPPAPIHSQRPLRGVAQHTGCIQGQANTQLHAPLYRHGAPSAARTPEGRWVGSFEGPGGAYAVEASTKREAYRLARREWLRRLLGG